MTQLTTTNGLALNLLPAEREVAIAFQSKLLSVISKTDLEVDLIKLIERTYLVCGYKYDGKMGAIQAQEFAKDLKAYFYTITIAEVELAFAKGVRKEYGEYMGLSVATYFVWIKTYMSSSTRMEAKKKQALFKAEREKPIELTDEEKDKILRQGALDAFEYFKKHGHYPDNGNPIYNWLDKNGIIPFDIPRKQKFMELAKQSLAAQMESKKESTADIHERRNLKKAIVELETEGADRIKREAKRIALCTFFKELIEMDDELKDLL